VARDEPRPGINLFLGFPVDSGRCLGRGGCRPVGPTDGEPTSSYAEPTDLTGRITVLAEGTRGPLGQAYRAWQGITSSNPQIFVGPAMADKLRELDRGNAARRSGRSV
jgi:hypothetical protein